MRIRADILRHYQVIHTWTGIIAGLVLFIGFYAGSLTMFKPQIQQWATPPTQVLAAIEPTKLDLLVKQAMAEYQSAQQGFVINLTDNASPMYWYEQGGGRGIRLDDALRHASLSSEDTLISTTSSSNELGSLIDQLHRTAGIVGKVGHEDLGVLILGIAAVLYFLALVSGLIFLLPTLVKSLFALRSNKGSNRFWLDSHNLLGIFSYPFHLIIAWTVVVFAFHDLFYGGLSLIYGDKPLFEPRQSSEVVYQVEDLSPISSYLTKATEMAKDYQVTKLAFSDLNSNRPSLAIEVVSDNQMMRGGYSDFIYMNPYNFEVQFSTINDSEDGAYGPIVTSFFGLHFGNYAGLTGRWLYFVMGLMGAMLFYSGNLLWLEKRRIKSPTQTKSSRFMAALTVGVCLGSMLGVAITLLSTKWLYLLSSNINSHYLWSYYVIFFAAIAYSFLRGAAISAIHNLYALALACLLIPISSLLTHYISVSDWHQQSMPVSAIDWVAILFGVGFYVMARKTRQRALHGERHSIWAIAPVKHQREQAQELNDQTEIKV
ncbi:PepSY domain-containing protein [Shewanella sp. Scap07]|uniref:PepSY-associated TM helix domain-containing protein n=1 Tax=Shewanella sp. Scap07 TaxID=2589987 RepID=UPI0015B7CD9A|nr:PepSY-associated TM helix domain-containing protein [Shewanella sp. Scap07]QLE84223.1 PepSY domain-containing protein [Shewanella sp. Scap07]